LVRWTRNCRTAPLPLHPPPPYKILRGRRPVGKSELKARLAQAARNDTAALKYQFRFRPQKDRSKFQHPLRGGKSDAASPRLPQGTHEVTVWQRPRGRNVYAPCHLFLGDQIIDGPYEIRLVNPGYKLLPRAGSASEAKSYKTKQSIENTATIMAHGHRAAQSDFARVWGISSKKGFFPSFRHIDTEPPRGGRARLDPAKLSSELVHCTVQCVTVDGGSAGIHPETGRMSNLIHCRSKNTSGLRSGFHDLASIGRVVATVDTAPREIDDYVGFFQLAYPIP